MEPLAGGSTIMVEARHGKTVAPRPPSEVYGKARQANDRCPASFGGLQGLVSFGYPQAHGHYAACAFRRDSG
jgi:hypothetical protein